MGTAEVGIPYDEMKATLYGVLTRQGFEPEKSTRLAP
jgi:hypothetical protein